MRRQNQKQNRPGNRNNHNAEKTILLDELKTVSKALGTSLHEAYSHDDDAEEIEFELKRLLLLHEQREGVKSLRQNVVFAAVALECINNQFGEYAELKGFAKSVDQEAKGGRFDEALTRLHRKRWQSGVGVDETPERDLAIALCQSAGMFHIRKSGLLGDVMSAAM